MTVFLNDGPFSYQIITSTSTPITLGHRVCYICKAGTSPLQFILPVTCLTGFEAKIMGHSNLWQILQNAGQFCKIGEAQSTIGITGSIQADKLSDQVLVFCQTANVEFDCFPIKGSPNII